MVNVWKLLEVCIYHNLAYLLIILRLHSPLSCLLCSHKCKLDCFSATTVPDNNTIITVHVQKTNLILMTRERQLHQHQSFTVLLSLQFLKKHHFIPRIL